MKGDFINDLNPAQQEAVRETGGPSLIIAGAGSGKTRVLTYRVAWLLKEGVPASNILALTFTNKAAAEMKERIGRLVGFDVSRHLWMGTFHSIFSRILRIESASLGYTSGYTIYDTVDSKNLIKAIIKELKLDDQVYKPGDVFGRISAARNNLISAGAYASNAALIAEDTRNRRPMISEIFKIYHKRCRTADAMDFDDLLLNTNILFRDFPEILSKYQDTFRYILVDEYQDTNYAQYLIISKLAARHNNISVVGDDAQSIYSFRGARIENILNFKKDYPGYRLFRLEQNYRSTKNIVNAANSLIAKNKGQIPKKIWSDNATGEKLTLFECATDYEEGSTVAEDLLLKKSSAGNEYSDFAVLYRTNAQSRIFEEALRRRSVPYKVYGSLSFYQRKEIKDLLAYFRIAVNRRDQQAFYRILNYPARGIGKTTTDKLASYCEENEVNPLDIISDTGKYQGILNINRGTVAKLSGFSGLLAGFAEKAVNEDAWQAAMHIATASGILKDLFDPKSTENIAKYENIQELLNAVKEFTSRQSDTSESTTLTAFLQNVSLLTDADTDKPEDRNKVTLMTIHSAKGLEFKHVYVGGLEEELFPNRFASASLAELEEERRLFYVAVTRAGLTATLSWAQTRYRWGVPSICRPSRFIAEIDPQFLEHAGKGPFKGEKLFPREPGRFNTVDTGSLTSRISAGGSGPERNRHHPDTTQKSVTPLPSGSNFVRLEKSGRLYRNESSEQSVLKPGMMVEHDRFGKGEVLNIEGLPPNTRATVMFSQGGQKQLLLKFAKLRILS